jgi:hypothetical protein
MLTVLALQAQGLAFVADHFKEVLRETTAQLLPELQKSMSSEAERGLSDESVLYAKFKTIAEPLKELMGQIGRRRATNELCTDMLLDCQSSYLQVRVQQHSGNSQARPSLDFTV